MLLNLVIFLLKTVFGAHFSLLFRPIVILPTHVVYKILVRLGIMFTNSCMEILILKNSHSDDEVLFHIFVSFEILNQCLLQVASILWLQV